MHDNERNSRVSFDHQNKRYNVPDTWYFMYDDLTLVRYGANTFSNLPLPEAAFFLFVEIHWVSLDQTLHQLWK